ncbi:MAG: hypothetical protein AAGF26_00400 [Cyanobacteria bacterium P01_G01_bin.49]
MSSLPLSSSIRAHPWLQLSERERSFFCGDEYLPLPESHALQIASLEAEEGRRVIKWLLNPFDLRWTIESQFPCKVVMQLGDKWNSEAGIQTVRQWLHHRHVPYQRQVYLIYDYPQVVQMPWKLVVKYWDALAWSVGVEMLVLDSMRQWVCSFHHEDVITFCHFEAD